MIEFGKRKREYPVPEWVKRGNLRWVWGLWEPLNYYKRLGIRGNYEWMESWYLHAHEKETIKKLSDAGINCITTHFFKGFGLKAEHKEIARMHKFTQFCHDYGIKVFAYVQAGSLMYESFLEEVPEAKNWIVHDAEGKKKAYSTQYWRWIPCLSNPDFLSYIKRCIDRAVEAGADGIHFDNLFPRDCCCSRCQQDFRGYLKEEALFLLDEFNYSSFDKVEIPPEFYPGDPLGLQWRNFKNDRCLRFMRESYRYIKEINEEIAVGVNGYTFVQHSPVFCDYMDITFAETGWFPRMEDDRIVTQYHFLNRANALDVNAISASYDFSNGGNLYFPSLPASNQIKRNLAESALCGGHVLASFWAMLPDGHSGICAFEDKDRYNTLKIYTEFFSKYKNLIKPKRTLARAALMHSYSSFSLGRKEVIWESRCMQQFCIEHQLDYDVIFSENLSLLGKYDLLLLPDICSMSDTEIKKIAEYVKNGGNVIATRRTSLYNEDFKERADYGLAEVFGYSRYDRGKEPQINDYGVGKALFFPGDEVNIELEGHKFYNKIPDYPVWGDIMLAAIEEMASSVFIVRLNPKSSVVVTSFELDDGTKTVHLLNFDDNPVDKVEIKLSSQFEKINRIELYTPDDTKLQPQDVPFERRRDETLLTVSKLWSYCLLLIK